VFLVIDFIWREEMFRDFDMSAGLNPILAHNLSVYGLLVILVIIWCSLERNSKKEQI